MEIEISASTGAGRYALADSGFGYSQLLPIVVRALLLQPGESLTVEQPELHLHPALQIRLADFFATIAAHDRQVIIETHSEHIVNALRVRAAECPPTTDAETIRIYFIDASSAPPTVHDLVVGTDGSVDDWPPGFFGEALTLTGRLLRARARKV